MKLLLFTLVLLCPAFMSVAVAQDIIVVLSPYQQNAVANVKQVLKHLTTLETGSKAILIDGYYFKKIGVFKIPEQKTSPKALLKRNAKTVAALLRFAKGKPEQNSIHQTLQFQTGSNALRLPPLLRHIAENYAFVVGDGLDIVILGSPFYDDPAEPTVSMVGAYITAIDLRNKPI